MKRNIKHLAVGIGMIFVLIVCVFGMIRANRTKAQEIQWIDVEDGTFMKSAKEAVTGIYDSPESKLNRGFINYVVGCIEYKYGSSEIPYTYWNFTKDQIGSLCMYAVAEHPELFTIKRIGIDKTNWKLYFRYKYPNFIADAMQSDLDKIIAEFEENIPSGWTDMEKALYVYTYVASNIAPTTEHEEGLARYGDYWNEMDAYTALDGRRGTSRAMSFAFKVLADRLDIENSIAVEQTIDDPKDPSVLSGQNNYKNLIKLNRKWYYVDTFLGSLNGRGCVSYDYFMMSYTKAWGKELDQKYISCFDNHMWEATDTYYDNYDWCQEDEENAVNQGLMYYAGAWYANDGAGHILKYTCDGKELTLEETVGSCGEYVSGYMEYGTIYYTGGDDSIRAFGIDDASDWLVYTCPAAEPQEEATYFNTIMKKAAASDVVSMGAVEKGCLSENRYTGIYLTYDRSTVKIQSHETTSTEDGEVYYKLDMDEMTLTDCGKNKAVWLKAYALHGNRLTLYIGNTPVGDLLLSMTVEDSCLKAAGRYGKDYFQVNDRNIRSIYKNRFGQGVYRTDEDHVFLEDSCRHSFEILCKGSEEFGYYKIKRCTKCQKEWKYDFAREKDMTWWSEPGAVLGRTPAPVSWFGYFSDMAETLASKPPVLTMHPKPTRTPKITETPVPTETPLPSLTPTRTPVREPEMTVTPTRAPDITNTPVKTKVPDEGVLATNMPAVDSSLQGKQTTVPDGQTVPTRTPEVDRSDRSTGKASLKISLRQTAVKQVRITWNKNAEGAFVEIVRGKKGSNQGERIATVPLAKVKYTDRNNKFQNCWYRCYAVEAGIQKSISQKVSMTLYVYRAPKVRIQRKTFREGGYLVISLRKQQNCYMECYRKSGGAFRKLALQEARFYKGHRQLNIAYSRKMKSVTCRFRIYRKKGGKILYSAYTKPVTIRLR